jgi:hypothetical protein
MNNNDNEKSKFIVKLLRIFTRHLNEQNLTYSEHFIRAFKLSLRSGLASLVFFIHALFPFIFEIYGSVTISSIHNDINKKSNKTDIKE